MDATIPVPLLAALVLGRKPLPFPRAWLGRWEGPAVLMGGQHGRMRLVFSPDGRLELSEIERGKDDRLHRTANAGEIRRTRRGYELKGVGTLIDADGPQRAMASEIVFWTFRRLRLLDGILTVFAQEDPGRRGGTNRIASFCAASADAVSLSDC